MSFEVEAGFAGGLVGAAAKISSTGASDALPATKSSTVVGSLVTDVGAESPPATLFSEILAVWPVPAKAPALNPRFLRAAS